MDNDRLVDAVNRRARHAARLEGRLEGATDARDVVLGELARLDFRTDGEPSDYPGEVPELLRAVLARVLDELVERHRHDHAQALEQFVSTVRGREKESRT